MKRSDDRTLDQLELFQMFEGLKVSNSFFLKCSGSFVKKKEAAESC